MNIELRSISQNENHLILRVDAIKTSYKELMIWSNENDVIIDEMEIDTANDELVLFIALAGKTGL